MREPRERTRSVVAYDKATGRIVHVHLTTRPLPEHGAPDPAEAALQRLLQQSTSCAFLHIAEPVMQRGNRYRVDLSTGTLTRDSGPGVALGAIHDYPLQKSSAQGLKGLDVSAQPFRP